MSVEAPNDPWNPGLSSDIPESLKPQITLYRAEHALVSYAEAKELSALCGISVRELHALRPERLIIHELLVRVTADLSVPDGPTYEVLGLNLRGMVQTIHEQHVLPDIERLLDCHARQRAEAVSYVEQQLEEQLFAPEPPAERAAANAPGQRSFFARLFGKAPASPPPSATPASASASGMATGAAEVAALDRWRERLQASDDALHRACLDALIKVVGGIVGRRGRLLTDQSLTTRLVVNRVCNGHGSDVLGEALSPCIAAAIAAEGYRVLPAQEKPVVLNVKGASASGKSTIRPRQRELAGRLGIPWKDFALISPDYWRKQLLDYASLGDDYRYAAMLTGHELEIIDRKLDRYMARKASRGAMSHLLIDRFRFDSFSTGIGRQSGSRLLSRFGDRVFMFFMITPPAETVVRAFKRGLTTGRYKAVDDLLYHNVEAFTGMPALFFSWVRSTDKRVHFEFLDNAVPEGEVPKTAAFGTNDDMTILDAGLMIDIDRYRKVNVDARQPGDVLGADATADESNTEFLRRCVEQVRTVRFADPQTAEVFAQFRAGKLIDCSTEYLQRQPHEGTLMVALASLGCTASGSVDNAGEAGRSGGAGRAGNAVEAGKEGKAGDPTDAPSVVDVAREQELTLGRWVN